MKYSKEIPEYCNRVYAEVDLDAITRNMMNMKKHISPETKLVGVIKTDGYGHGSVEIAKALEELDYVWGFAVATPEEAHKLRREGITRPLLILGFTFPYCFEQLIEEDIRPALFREDSITELEECAGRCSRKVKVHIKVDTGMHRIGITPNEEGIDFVRKVMSCKNIEIEGIFTHFARADEADKANARLQLSVFTQFIDRIERELGLKIALKHCSNSAGIMELPEANMDMVRAGITLYGLYPSEEVDKSGMELSPALALYSRIVYIKQINKGDSVSYGGTFTADREMRIATIPVGYGDGYPRALSSKGFVLIHGKRAPILGRVCMDQMMVDVSHIPDARENDLVVLLGTDGEEAISAEELGELSGRFNYELMCDLGKRVPRVYVKDNKIVKCNEYI